MQAGSTGAILNPFLVNKPVDNFSKKHFLENQVLVLLMNEMFKMKPLSSKAVLAVGIVYT